MSAEAPRGHSVLCAVLLILKTHQRSTFNLSHTLHTETLFPTMFQWPTFILLCQLMHLLQVSKTWCIQKNCIQKDKIKKSITSSGLGNYPIVKYMCINLMLYSNGKDIFITKKEEWSEAQSARSLFWKSGKLSLHFTASPPHDSSTR